MEAILDKKSPKKKTARWQPRLFRLKDRRLIHFKKGVLDGTTAFDSAAKYTLDLTHLTSLIIDKKNANILIIYHPIIDLALRFKTNELLVCWLKVFSSFTKNFDKIENGPNIKTSIPSNYLFSIWHILQALYSHPNLQTSEGIFRKASDKIEKNTMFNELLQQTYDINTLQNYKNIHVLSNVLCNLLTNLPSTIFKEKQIEILVTFFDKKRILKDVPLKQGQHVDYDVSIINKQYIKKLKLSMETLYLSNKTDRHRYGLMTLIFHLLKQIIVNETNTKQTAESLSVVFAEIFESKIFLMKLKNPMDSNRSKYLIKALIYWAYDIFSEQQWIMNDIVITEECEMKYMNEYNQYHKKKQSKHKKSKSGQWKDKYLLSKKQLSEKELKLEHQNENELPENSTKKKFVSHFKNPSLSGIPKDLKITDEIELKENSRRNTVDVQVDNKLSANNDNRERASTEINNENKIESVESDNDEKLEVKQNENKNSNEKSEVQTKANSEEIVAKPNKIDEKRRDDLNIKMEKRMSWKEVNSRGIVLDSEQTKQKEKHKRNASQTINKLLTNRPTPNDLHSQNILLEEQQIEQRQKHKREASGTIDKLLLNRPSPTELYSQNILFKETQIEQKQKHKRQASGTIDKLLMNRPSPSDLHSQNIINTKAALYYGADKNEIYSENINKQNFEMKLAQRPTWEEVNKTGIVLDAKQTEQRQKHKRKASGTIDKLLMNRPSPNELYKQNILFKETQIEQKQKHKRQASGTIDKLLMNRPSPNDLYKQNILLEEKEIEQRKKHKRVASGTIDKLLMHRPKPSDLQALNIMKNIWGTNEIDVKRLENKLKQRPSISETIGRGILLYRTDLNINYNLQEAHKELDKRKASQKIEKFIMKRPSENELKKKSILVTSKGIEQKRKHKRKTSKDLEIGLKNRMAWNEIKYDKKYNENLGNGDGVVGDPALDVYKYMVKLFDMMYNVRTPCIDANKTKLNI